MISNKGFLSLNVVTFFDWYTELNDMWYKVVYIYMATKCEEVFLGD